MPIYYSASNEGFYNTDVVTYPVLPDDCVLISEAEQHTFLKEMNNNNKKLVLEKNKLVLIDRPIIVTWEIIRLKRNKLLDESDYTQVADFGGDKQAWTNYRQLLRDLPQTYKTPEEVVWPVKPKK
jgi:hypothetical protein